MPNGRWGLVFALALMLPAGLGAGDGAQGRLDLGGTWRLTWTDGGHGPTAVQAFVTQAGGDAGRYLDVPVPMELTRFFQQIGLVADPNQGINSLRARWVAEQYYQYARTFEAPPEALGRRAWLVFDQLDLNATILLNGVIVARHANAHRPCRVEVTGRLRPGTNRLAVGLESGLYLVADKPGDAYSDRLETALNKRHWLRKAQYQFLWDWSPRLINVGITGPVALEWAGAARLDQVTVWASPSADSRQANVVVRPFIEGLKAGEKAIVRVRVRETGTTAEREVTLRRGLAAYPVELVLERPRLWWPRGHGDPALYTVEVGVSCGDELVGSVLRRVGVRRVELDRSRHPETGEHFIVRVNGRPIFCRGANWVPPDMIVSAVSRERLQRLVDQALAANFNLLRIWGGGAYAGHDLLGMCDEAGLLVWHDLPFACAKYPADDPSFRADVESEVTWAVREIAHHPSLIVWCGNNELELGAYEWGYATAGRSLPDYSLFHLTIPRILRAEDPQRPYWPSSPYSPDQLPPNDPTVGDQHPWQVSLGEDGPDFWGYRRRVDRFPNEGGVLGASSPATLRQFLPEDQRHLRSFAWEHHDNNVNFWHDRPGLTYQMVERWLGRDYRKMTLDEYAFASALLQSEGLQEYINNYRRRMFSSAAAIFWMYNDSWPVTHGWTIVDYYGRRKLAYHPVRRAFAPVTVVLAEEGRSIVVFGVNESPKAREGVLRVGFFGLDGVLPLERRLKVVLPANASTKLASLERGDLERLGVGRHGAFAVLDLRDLPAVQGRLLLARFRDLEWTRPAVNVARAGEQAVFSAPGFVWGATLDVDGQDDVPDDCFDLLPGIPYAVPWPAGRALPVVRRTGNDLLLDRLDERSAAEASGRAQEVRQ